MTDTPIQKAGEVEFDEFFITNQQKKKRRHYTNDGRNRPV